jgi:hypothetical protein
VPIAPEFMWCFPSQNMSGGLIVCVDRSINR